MKCKRCKKTGANTIQILFGGLHRVCNNCLVQLQQIEEDFLTNKLVHVEPIRKIPLITITGDFSTQAIRIE